MWKLVKHFKSSKYVYRQATSNTIPCLLDRNKGDISKKGANDKNIASYVLKQLVLNNSGDKLNRNSCQGTNWCQELADGLKGANNPSVIGR